MRYKHITLAALLAASTAASATDTKPIVSVGGKATEKAVTQLTFADGEAITLHYVDGTSEEIDLALVRIVTSSDTGIDLPSTGSGHDQAPSYFDLQGKQLNAPPRTGAYIVKKGKKVVKVIK